MTAFRSKGMGWSTVLGAAACLVMGASTATADTATDAAQRAIRQNYAALDAAAVNQDFDALWSYNTDNYVWISRDGRRKTLDQLKAETARLYGAAESISSKCIIEKFSLKGNTATVVARGTGTVVVRVSETRRNTMSIRERSMDTWVNRGGRWLLSQTKSISESVTLNGKPFKY